MSGVAHRTFQVWLNLGFKALLAGLLAGVGLTAAAGEWPERNIKLVVPYPAGGLTDIVSRVVGDEVGKILGTSVTIENKSGAGGQIGLQSVLQSPKDGYTVALVVPATMVTLPLTNPDYKIKPLQDFEPITIAIDTFLTLVVSNGLGVKTFGDFLALAKKQPGHLSYGVPGTGTSFHFNNVIMAQKLGIETRYAPYKGEGQILNDITGGVLQYALVSNAGKAYIDSGQVTALAVTAEKRVKSMPQLPTFKELGYDFTTDGWLGYAVSKGTPKHIVDKLSQAFVKALTTPTLKQKLTDMGYHVVASTPEKFVSEVREGTKKYGDLLRSGAIKID